MRSRAFGHEAKVDSLDGGIGALESCRARQYVSLLRQLHDLDQVFGLATPREGILSGTQPTNH